MSTTQYFLLFLTRKTSTDRLAEKMFAKIIYISMFLFDHQLLVLDLPHYFLY